MRRLQLVLAGLLWIATAALAAQEPAAAPPVQDEGVQEAAQIEDELGKLNDGAPESADLLARLVDLYLAEGRIFGLIRSGENFVNNHPLDARHKDAMLKLIDGYAAMSRNKEV